MTSTLKTIGRILIGTMIVACGRIGVETRINDDSTVEDSATQDIETTVKEDTETVPDMTTDSAVDTETGIDGDTDGDSDTDADGDTDTDGDTDADGDTDTDADADSATSADTETNADTETDPGTDGFDECAAEMSGAVACVGFEDDADYIEFVDGEPDAGVEFGSVSLDNTTVYTGNTSMYLETTESRSFAHIRIPFDPITSGTLYFRAYFLIPEGVVDDLIKLAALEGWDPAAANDDDEGAELNVDISVVADGSLQLYYHQTEGRYFSDPGIVPENAWFCLSGAMEISDSGETSVDINGATVINVSQEDTLPPNGVSRGSFGIGWTDRDQPTARVYIDNIVIDTAPVGCL